MGNRTLRAARLHRAVLLGLTGFLTSCTASSPLTEMGGPASGEALTAASHIDVSDNIGAADLEKQFEDVSRRVSPAVVAISATDTHVDSEDALRSDQINGDRLSALLSSVDRTVGTGFIVDADGYIATNDHVIAHSEQLWVTTDDHKVYPAIVVGTDPRSDLALLKVPATKLPVVHFADGAAVRRGQWTIAIGNPYGLAGTGEMCASVGIVGATGRSLPKLSGKEDRLYSDLIQTTAQINPGNSGGPLFDIRGDVIGINTAVILPQKQVNGIGFAMPITKRLLHAIDQLKQGREVVYGYLGVRVASATPSERRAAGIEGDGGARIENVDSDSPALAAGLKTGDIVSLFDNAPVQDGDHLVRMVGDATVERPVPVRVFRDGKTRVIPVSLRRREVPAATITRETQRFRWRGMLLGPIPAHWDFASAKRPSNGIMVVGVDSNSRSAKEGIREGAVITAVGGKPVTDLLSLQRVIDSTPPERCKVCVFGASAELAIAEE